jgi:hypothetical protein
MNIDRLQLREFAHYKQDVVLVSSSKLLKLNLEKVQYVRLVILATSLSDVEGAFSEGEPRGDFVCEERVIADGINVKVYVRGCGMAAFSVVSQRN